MNYRVFLLFGILLLCSCQSALDIELTYIESVIEDHPDSAIIKLKEIDQVAYIRFVSVYRSFDDIDSFLKELEIFKTDSQK